MREITEGQIKFIIEDLKKRGLVHEPLLESVTDHICCAIEEDSEAHDFEHIYQKTINSFGHNGLYQIQQDTLYLINLKNRNMKKTIYLLGYIAAVLCTTGILFKLLHWQGANIILVSGIALLNIGFLPAFFFDRYKSAVSK